MNRAPTSMACGIEMREGDVIIYPYVPTNRHRELSNLDIKPGRAKIVDAFNGHDRIRGDDFLDDVCRRVQIEVARRNLTFSLSQVAFGNSQ